MKINYVPINLESNDKYLNFDETKRPITFDSIFEDRTFVFNMHASVWLQKQFKKIKFEVREGLYSRVDLINRDEEETPTKTIFNHNYFFQIKFKKINFNNEFKKIINNIYFYLHEISDQLKKKIE